MTSDNINSSTEGNNTEEQSSKEAPPEATSDDSRETYHPTDEYDGGEVEEKFGVGAHRRETLTALDAKDRLDTLESDVDCLADLTEAIREISLAKPNGTLYMAPPTDLIETIEAIHTDLPTEAQSKYVTDDILHRRINAARKQFNEWMDKRRREKKIPSPVEAGPANYPADKARKVTKRAHDASTGLDDSLGRIEASARGARQRALEAIGSSVAEQNEERAKSTIERRREEWSSGDLVTYRNPHKHAGIIVRVNKKSVRVERRNLRQQADFTSDDSHIRETIDLDSDFLTRHSPSELKEIEDSDLDGSQTVPETLEEAHAQMLAPDTEF